MSSDSFPPPSLKAAAEEVAALLRDRKETVCVAESAAGGLISAALLSTPGASRIFKGGLTVYTLESRMAYVGWTDDNVKAYNGPTPEVVKGLATNARDTLKATYGVGESGMAGPTGLGSARNRQPGYVALAVVSESGSLARDLDTGCGSDRQANMVAFAVKALELVREFILSSGSGSGDTGEKL